MKPMGASDAALLRELVEKRQMLLCEAMRIVGARDLAEDVVQDTILRCLAPERPVRAVSRPGAYARAMVRHMALDHLRRQGRQQADPYEDTAAGDLSGEMKLAARQELGQVARALARLPPRTRDSFLRHRLSAVQQKQIAEELAVSRTLVNFMIRDADAACRAALGGS